MTLQEQIETLQQYFRDDEVVVLLDDKISQFEEQMTFTELIKTLNELQYDNPISHWIIRPSGAYDSAGNQLLGRVQNEEPERLIELGEWQLNIEDTGIEGPGRYLIRLDGYNVAYYGESIDEALADMIEGIKTLKISDVTIQES